MRTLPPDPAVRSRRLAQSAKVTQSACKRLKIGTTELAKRLGLAPSTVYRWGKGERVMSHTAVTALKGLLAASRATNGRTPRTPHTAAVDAAPSPAGHDQQT